MSTPAVTKLVTLAPSLKVLHAAKIYRPPTKPDSHTFAPLSFVNDTIKIED